MARAPRARTAAQGSRTPTEFETRVYKLCKQIPKGKVSTYGAMARVLGNAPRAVGQALRRNPFAPEVPCHRVIAASLDLGGFSGQWGPTTPNVCRKRELLATEGVRFDEAGHLLDKGTCLDVAALQAIAGQKGLKKEP